MRRLAEWCVRHRRITVLSWIGLLVVCVAAAGATGSTFKSNFNLPASDSQQAVDLLKKNFPAQSGDSAQIVFHTPNGPVTAAAVRARADAMLAKVGALPHVAKVTSPFGPAGARAVSPDGKTAFATVQFDQRSCQLKK